MDENLNLHPHDAAPGADVVLFAPEMLRLMDSRQRRLRQQLAECREAARQGDAQAQVQMGLGVTLSGGFLAFGQLLAQTALAAVHQAQHFRREQHHVRSRCSVIRL